MIKLRNRKKIWAVVLILVIVVCFFAFYSVNRTRGVSDFFIDAFTPFFESGGEGYTVMSHQGIDITEEFYEDNIRAFRIGNWRAIRKNADRHVGKLISD